MKARKKKRKKRKQEETRGNDRSKRRRNKQEKQDEKYHTANLPLRHKAGTDVPVKSRVELRRSHLRDIGNKACKHFGCVTS
jgi:hypothetical protein